MLFKSGIIVALGTLFSRIFGLAKELFIAANFGTSSIADCVNIALRLPNLFRRIFAEGALSLVFVPIFSRKFIIAQPYRVLVKGRRDREKCCTPC